MKLFDIYKELLRVIKKQLVPIFCLVAALQIFNAVDFAYGQEKPVTLRVEMSFPNEDDEVLLSAPYDMVMDEENNLFICDFNLNFIAKFSPSGEFLYKFGKSGQGPGEFKAVAQITYAEGKIYINDHANRRIQTLNTDGTYLSDFKVFYIPKEFSAYKDKLYVLNTSSALHMSDDAPKPGELIWIFDASTGRKEASFGDHFSFSETLSPYASEAELIFYDHRLYAFSVYYPILRVYTLDGRLEKTMTFEGMNYKDRVPQNYRWDKLRRKLQIVRTRYLFRAFDVNELGIYMALFSPDEGLIIDHFNFEGEFQNRYIRKKQAEQYYLYDMEIVALPSGKAKFYVLAEDEFPQVTVYNE